MTDPEEELLQALEEKHELPHFIDERGVEYVLDQRDERKWEVKKLEGDSCTTYYLGNIKGRWLCSCPAGTRGRKCKHALWVGVLAQAWRGKNGAS